LSELSKIEKAYKLAKDSYSQLGISTDKALEEMESISLSLHCWQGDDVGGFENPDPSLSGGGIQVTGNFPGKATNANELRLDLRKAYSLIPGKHRLNLHAIYGEFKGQQVDRDEISPEHFKPWIDWANQEGIKLDFNATCFSHPKADEGFTLSHKNKGVRDFWIEHVRRCREISSYMGKAQNSPCIHNLWVPDGSKDITVDAWLYRSNLKESLDRIFDRDYPEAEIKDSLESKLFGIGSECYVVGSHEFYLGYALAKGKMICLDTGHFHPTESVADKISSVLLFLDELLLHVSRGVRWDSDHVVILNDEVTTLAKEIIRANVLSRVHFGLDFFDASINRIGAWVIGSRALLKALLIALLEPLEKLKEAEDNGDFFSRLAVLEEMKSMPFQAVWDYYCLKMSVPPAGLWIGEIKQYEKDVLFKRK
jgi:L-rhamnose isomerase